AAQIRELSAISTAELSSQARFLVVTSTWGDGDPPDNAVEFWKQLNDHSMPRLERLNFAVLALGDRNYTDFCGAGRTIDERLASLGPKRIRAGADCDVDYGGAANKWIADVWPALGKVGSPIAAATPVAGTSAQLIPAADSVNWSRNNPFRARLLVNR